MADDIQVSTGLGGTAYISADDASGRLVQRVKLAYSADGAATHVPADASGLLVNLGANNDVTITGGTVTVGGTANVSVAGTANVAVTSMASLAAGTAYAGVMAIGTASTVKATMQSLTSGTALSVSVLDGDGSPVSFSLPVILTGALTNGTAAYSSGDTMGTALSFSGASNGSGLTGHVINAICYVTSNVQDQDLRLWLFDSSVTPSADNATFNLTTTDIVKTQGVISFDDWYDGGTVAVSVGRLSPAGHPLHYNTTGASTLYGVMESRGTGTYATATVSVELHVLKD